MGIAFREGNKFQGNKSDVIVECLRYEIVFLYF